MTLAGTRPPTVDEWDKYELHHRARLATKPGLTGMWQVSGRSNITDLGSVTIGTIIITAILMKSDIISITMINKLGKDFQYNLLSFSGVLAGFLFTGVGILI